MIPIENPRYLICVLLDEPTKVQYGGIIAAPVFRHVALNTMAYHGLLPDVDDPLVQAIALKEAERKKGKKDANPELTAKAAAPGRQAAGRVNAPGQDDVPPPERSVQAAGRVPAVVGMGLRSAVEIFAARGVMPVIKGTGDFVTRQAPEAGSPWPDGARECTLWLEERTS
jgi:cell division protein FtsI (penicillin-binding protein 3)